jgi:hypothetical protein
MCRDKQHIALFLGMGGLTPCQDVVDLILMSDDGKAKTILDIGMSRYFGYIPMLTSVPRVRQWDMVRTCHIKMKRHLISLLGLSKWVGDTLAHR